MGKFTKSSNPPEFFNADKGDVRASDTAAISQKMSKRTKRAKLDPEQQAIIGRHLQTLYDEVANQILPQKLQDLLETLDPLPKKNGR